jgi:hypothetical protein
MRSHPINPGDQENVAGTQEVEHDLKLGTAIRRGTAALLRPDQVAAGRLEHSPAVSPPSAGAMGRTQLRHLRFPGPRSSMNMCDAPRWPAHSPGLASRVATSLRSHGSTYDARQPIGRSEDLVEIPNSPSIAALRAALDVPEGTLIEQHTGLINERTQGHPHTVRLVSKPQDGTCVSYAFDLTNQPIYRAIATDFDRQVFAGRQFVEWMIGNRLNEVERPNNGSLVVYFSGSSDWKHVGVATGPERALSQWGTYPIYDHGLCEVPASYGSEMRFFEKPSPQQALSNFLDFARSEGVSNEDIEAIAAEVADQSKSTGC